MNRITTHPGEVLKEELEARGMSQKKFSELLNVPYTQLNEIHAVALQHVCCQAEEIAYCKAAGHQACLRSHFLRQKDH